MGANISNGSLYRVCFQPRRYNLRKTWAAGAQAGNAISVTATPLSSGGSASVVSTASAAGNTTVGAQSTIQDGGINFLRLPAETFSSGSQSSYGTAVTCSGAGTVSSGGNGSYVYEGSTADKDVTCTYTNTFLPAGTTFSNAAPSTGWSCANGAAAGAACSQTVLAPAGGAITASFRVVVNTSITGLAQIANNVTSSAGGCRRQAR